MRAPLTSWLSIPLLITSLSWALNFPALKLLYREMTPPAVALTRFVLMGAMLWVACRLRGETLRYPGWRDTLSILWLGFLSMGFYMVLFLQGMDGSTAAEAAIILATAPIFTMLIGAFRKQEPASAGMFFGGLIALFGVGLVIFSGSTQAHGALISNLMILVGAAVWAYSTTLMRSLMDRRTPLQLVTLSMPGAFVALLPYGLLPTLAVPWGGLSATAWLIILHISVISGVIGFVGFFEGVRQIGAGRAMLYQYFVPPIAALFAWLLLGTPLTVQQGLGLIVVTAGVVLANRARRLQAT